MDILQRALSSVTVSDPPNNGSAPILLALPNELIIKVLAYLPWPDVVNCRCISSFLRNLVDESVNLQYHIALGWTALEDGGTGPGSTDSTASRLESLLSQQHRWRNIQWSKKTHIHVEFITTYVYELSGGMFVLGHGGDDDNAVMMSTGVAGGGPGAPPATQSLNVMRLPLAGDVGRGSRPGWRQTELGSRVADFGMDVEQDLLILIEPADGIRPIRVHFRTFSTNQPHPAAATPIFEYPCEIPHSYQFVIHMVGSHVGILFSSSLPDSDRLIIYSWTTGFIRGYVDAPPGGSWTSFAFLSPFDFLIPTRDATLEVYTFDPNSTIEPPPELKPAVVFNLPERSRPDFPLFHFTCRTYPLPRGDLSHLDGKPGIQRPPPMPFRTARDDSIMVFSFITLAENDTDGVLHQAQVQVGLTFIIHRSSLLDIVSQSRGTVEREVNWEEWGPERTRWLDGHRPTRWICYVHGHRLVTMEEEPTWRSTICIYDFNPVAIARARSISVPRDLVTASTPSVFLDENALFKVEVIGTLPYLHAQSDDTFLCSGAMIDDHRIMLMQAAPMGALRRAVLLVM